jgi:CTP synthase
VDEVEERHRHRYEFNNAYREALGTAGLVASGLSPDEQLVEISELADHPFMLGSQFHPEFRSRPLRPHPLFRDFIGAAVAYAAERTPEELKTAPSPGPLDATPVVGS